MFQNMLKKKIKKQVWKMKLFPSAEQFPRQQFMNPCPGHKAPAAGSLTVAEAALQQILQQGKI